MRRVKKRNIHEAASGVLLSSIQKPQRFVVIVKTWCNVPVDLNCNKKCFSSLKYVSFN